MTIIPVRPVIESVRTAMMPPFGNPYGLPDIVDWSLVEEEVIGFNECTHMDSVRMTIEESEGLVSPPAMEEASQEHGQGTQTSSGASSMSTSALVLMIIVWTYITLFLVYFFTKILRKERDKKRTREHLPGD